MDEVADSRQRSSGTVPPGLNAAWNDEIVDQPTLHLLSYELYVARIRKESLSSVTHSLLQLLLRLFGESSDCRRGHFFNFTETASEYSVILDSKLLEILQPPSSGDTLEIEISKFKWRPFVVEVGALGSLTGISSIVASLISPLADHNVSVFCLSTNLDDFVMVKQKDLDKALTCLASRFKLVCDSDCRLDLATVQSVCQRSTTTEQPNRKNLKTSLGSLSELVMARPIVHPYSCSTSQYSICGIIPSALSSIGTSLLELMLFSHRTSSTDQSFLSFSIVEDDISIILNHQNIARFPENSLYLNKEMWRMIRIGEGPLGFDECGIVAQVSAPLAEAQISTCYICTFSTDHVLVPEEITDRALTLLNDRYISKVMKKGSNGLICNGSYHHTMATTASASKSI